MSYLNLSYLAGLQYVLVPFSFDRVVSEGSPAPPPSPTSPIHHPTPPPSPLSQCDAPPTVAQHQLSLSSALWASLCVPKNTKSSPRSIVCRSNKHLLFSFCPSFIPSLLPSFVQPSFIPSLASSFLLTLLFFFFSSFLAFCLSSLHPTYSNFLSFLPSLFSSSSRHSLLYSLPFPLLVSFSSCGPSSQCF